MSQPPPSPPDPQPGLLWKLPLYLGVTALLCLAWWKTATPIWHPALRSFALAIPLLLVLALDALPSILARRRLRRLVQLGRTPHFEPPGYFRLGPYENTDADRKRYQRNDGKHRAVLQWLVRGNSRIFYLSGRSGTGKSSLLDAFVLPRLSGPPLHWKVLTLPTGADPLTSLTQALLERGRIWQDPPHAIKDLNLLLARACGESSHPLLLVFDQFEEFLIHNSRENTQRIHHFVSFASRMIEKGPSQLKLLLVFRSDYIKPLLDLHLPHLIAQENWLEVPPFLPEDARHFLQASPLEISPRLLDHLLHEIYEIEETKGLIRPITLNIIGRVLESASFAERSHLDYEHGLLRLMNEGLSQSLYRADIRAHVLAVLKPMLTEDGTKRQCTVTSLAERAQLDPDLVRGVLVRLAQQGLVRPLHNATETWSIAHDFVAKQLDLLLRKWRGFRHWHPRTLLVTLLLWVGAVFFLYPATVAAMRNRTMAAIVSQGGELSEDQRGQAVRFRNHPRLDTTTVYLSKLDHLYKLDISGTQVTDLAALTQLDRLQVLVLSGAQNADLSTLLGPSGLRELDLSNLPLDSIDHLSRLSRLERLDLSGSKIEHLDAIASFPNLRKLHLRHTDLRSRKVVQSNVSFAEMSLAELMHLDVSPDDAPYLTELSRAPWLTWLDLKATFVADLDPLLALPHLQGLELAETKLSDIGPLAELKQLSYLDLSNTKLKSLAPLAHLKQLETLILNGTKVSELTPLKALKQLHKLRLAHTDVADLTPLRPLLNLTELNLSYTFVADIAPLAALPQLQVLDLSGTTVAKLDGLRQLKNLTHLNLAETEVRELANLAEAHQLRVLNLARTAIKDLRPLYDLQSLETLDLTGTNFSKKEYMSLSKALPRVKLYK